MPNFDIYWQVCFQFRSSKITFQTCSNFNNFSLFRNWFSKILHISYWPPVIITSSELHLADVMMLLVQFAQTENIWWIRTRLMWEYPDHELRQCVSFTIETLQIQARFKIDTLTESPLTIITMNMRATKMPTGTAISTTDCISIRCNDLL